MTDTAAPTQYDVIAIGNAIVDVMAPCEDARSKPELLRCLPGATGRVLGWGLEEESLLALLRFSCSLSKPLLTEICFLISAPKLKKEYTVN